MRGLLLPTFCPYGAGYAWSFVTDILPYGAGYAWSFVTDILPYGAGYAWSFVTDILPLRGRIYMGLFFYRPFAPTGQD